MDRTEDQRLIDSAREYGMEFPSVPCGQCGEPTYFLPGEAGSQESGHYLYHDHDDDIPHVDYPHWPGYLHDCPACEARCFCTAGNLECVFEGEHNGTGEAWGEDDDNDY